MSIKFLHSRAAGRGVARASPRSGQEGPQGPGTDVINWRVEQCARVARLLVGQAEANCRHAVGPDGPDQADLLLYRHHYAVPRQALAVGVSLAHE